MTRLERLLCLVALAFVLAVCAPAALAQCAPSDVGGTGTPARFEFGATSDAVGWWCQGKYKPSRKLFAAKHTWLTGAAKTSLLALRTAPDKPAAIASAAAANVNSPLSYIPAAEPLSLRLAADRPPNPAWTVAKNGSYATRPTRTFLWNDASQPFIVGDSSVRIAVGAPCRCQDAVVEVGSTSWCQVGRESVEGYVMAVCSRQ
jgi:hypothetical protein